MHANTLILSQLNKRIKSYKTRCVKVGHPMKIVCDDRVIFRPVCITYSLPYLWIPGLRSDWFLIKTPPPAAWVTPSANKMPPRDNECRTSRSSDWPITPAWRRWRWQDGERVKNIPTNVDIFGFIDDENEIFGKIYLSTIPINPISRASGPQRRRSHRYRSFYDNSFDYIILSPGRPFATYDCKIC